MLTWMWDNPWSILLVFVILLGLALWARKASVPDYFYVRGKPRCSLCLDGTRSRNKVVYNSREAAATEAERNQKKYGRQWPYRAPCGYWHLSSQGSGKPRQRSQGQ